MQARASGTLAELLEHVVPGSILREGLERILSARMGALIVIGDDARVLELCTGGFHIDAELSPQRLSELAKMDGAMIVNRSVTRIAWANVQLMPDPSVPTTETGTRHRTAERVARMLSVPVIAVSEEMGGITLYAGAARRELESTESIANRVNHLLQALSRFKAGFDEASTALADAEAHATPTLGDLALLVQRGELVRRVAAEITTLVTLLGEQGRLARSELSELTRGVAGEERLVYRVAAVGDPIRARAALSALALEDLRSLDRVVAVLAGEDATPADVVALRPVGAES